MRQLPTKLEHFFHVKTALQSKKWVIFCVKNLQNWKNLQKITIKDFNFAFKRCLRPCRRMIWSPILSTFFLVIRCLVAHCGANFRFFLHQVKCNNDIFVNISSPLVWIRKQKTSFFSLEKKILSFWERPLKQASIQV